MTCNPKEFVWSRIQDTNLAKAAHDKMRQANNEYHNLNHLSEMYQYLADMGEPYDAALDWAVLYHDVIYDERPEKEKRSAEYFIDMTYVILPKFSLNAATIQQVHKMIMQTAAHEFRRGDDTRIIRADLHGLANNASAFRNHHLIMKESMRLYGIDMYDFASNSITFMEALGERVEYNDQKDPQHSSFWNNVYSGILFTVKLNKFLKKQL